jgi:hypothetical protein
VRMRSSGKEGGGGAEDMGRARGGGGAAAWPELGYGDGDNGSWVRRSRRRVDSFLQRFTHMPLKTNHRYVHDTKSFVGTCVPCTQLFFTYMSFRPRSVNS